MSQKNQNERSPRPHGLIPWRCARPLRKRIVLCVPAVAILGTGSAIADIDIPNLFPFLDLTGFSSTDSTTGSIDVSGPFFQSLGTNGRSCGTCHAPADGFGLSAMDAQFRYFISRGKDPLFAQIDGATCPTGPINNSLIVNNGLIRIGIQIPPDTADPNSPQFTIVAVRDPYGCALTTNSQGQQTASMYRRPLPATNLSFLSMVMFDGRESFASLEQRADLCSESEHRSDATSDRCHHGPCTGNAASVTDAA